MTYKDTTYTSQWKVEDYGIIEIESGEVKIVGTHRYGTRAASLYYKEKNPTKNTLIHWKDSNDDEKVQIEEINIVE